MSKHQPEDVRRRQILDAAKACFISRGLDATTMRDVAREAQLSLGGIYFHFKSKEEIFRAICTETYGTLLRRWEEEPVDGGTVVQRLRQLAEVNVAMIETDPDYFRLALVLNGAAVVDEDLKALKREHHQAYVAFIAGILVRGVASGELREHDAGAMAQAIVALFDGFYLRRAIDADIAPRRAILGALDLVLSGLAAS